MMKSLYGVLAFIFQFSLDKVNSIDCFKCISINGEYPPCEDPFHNNYTTEILNSPCMGGRKGRDGLFPATSCIKITGIIDETGEKMILRGCALDSGTLTTDTEIVRMSHCGGFYYDGNKILITREIRDEIRNSVASSISSLKEDDFLTRIAQKVTEIVAKTIEEKMYRLEKKVKECIHNSPVVEELKGEVAVLKSENDYLMRKFDEYDQRLRKNNVRIFNLPEKENEDLSTEIKRIFLDNLKLKGWKKNRYVKGCVQSCNDVDACNSAGQKKPPLLSSITIYSIVIACRVLSNM
nr:unnamed protein product [Callosobruchus analis]